LVTDTVLVAVAVRSAWSITDQVPVPLNMTVPMESENGAVPVEQLLLE
jgi:hypothetical protein